MSTEITVHAVREFEGLPQIVCFYAKGHHSRTDFLTALSQRKGWENARSTTLPVKHEWYRGIPTGEKGQTTLEGARPGARGAFPVTVMHV